MSIRKLQLRLKQIGLYAGKVTGEANKATAEALSTYRDREIYDPEIDRLLGNRTRL